MGKQYRTDLISSYDPSITRENEVTDWGRGGKQE